jgi:phosphohistidine phosphatase
MPDIVLSSPYTRARETAEILAVELDIKSSLIKFSDDLVPMAQPSSLLKEIAERFLVDNLAVVGHEPHLSSLISYLLTGKTEMSTDLKKGGVCLISLLIETQSWQASLEWLMTPRQLLAIGKS